MIKSNNKRPNNSWFDLKMPKVKGNPENKPDWTAVQDPILRARIRCPARTLQVSCLDDLTLMSGSQVTNQWEESNIFHLQGKTDQMTLASSCRACLTFRGYGAGRVPPQTSRGHLKAGMGWLLWVWTHVMRAMQTLLSTFHLNSKLPYCKLISGPIGLCNYSGHNLMHWISWRYCPWKIIDQALFDSGNAEGRVIEFRINAVVVFLISSKSKPKCVFT